MNIKRVIKARGLTVKTVADRMGIAREGLSNHINGNPSVQILERIAAAIGCSVSEFFDDGDGSDFIAFVRNHGETHTFDTPTALIEYADSLKGDASSEAPAAPAASTAPVQASIYDDPIFR